MSLTCKIKVSLHDIPKKKASAIIEALHPDNVNFPKGLSLESKILIMNLFLILKAEAIQKNWYQQLTKF